MDTTRYPGNNDFAAFDFGEESVPHFGDESVPNFGEESIPNFGEESVPNFDEESSYDSGERSFVDVLDIDEPAEPAETGTELSAIDALPEDSGDSADIAAAADEPSPGMATVTNPPETVTVTALMGGGVHRVELSADAGRMTEPELADEILVIADLASQKAASVLHTMLTENVKAAGVDDRGILPDLLAPRMMNLPSPKQAAEAEAEVFATRYANDEG